TFNEGELDPATCAVNKAIRAITQLGDRWARGASIPPSKGQGLGECVVFEDAEDELSWRALLTSERAIGHEKKAVFVHDCGIRAQQAKSERRHNRGGIGRALAFAEPANGMREIDAASCVKEMKRAARKHTAYERRRDEMGDWAHDAGLRFAFEIPQKDG